LCAETAITGARGEIQPHQPLIESAGETFGPEKHAKALTSEKAPLYKGANGGGRNPAAAVLWAAPAPSDIADGLSATAFPETSVFKDNQQRRSRGSSGRRAHAIKSEQHAKDI
jgi:hypothetical protein